MGGLSNSTHLRLAVAQLWVLHPKPGRVLVNIFIHRGGACVEAAGAGVQAALRLCGTAENRKRLDSWRAAWAVPCIKQIYISSVSLRLRDQM